MTAKTQHHYCRLRLNSIPALCMLVLAAVLVTSPAAAQTYSGRAFSAYINAPTLGAGPIYLSDTGPLPTSGDWQGAGALGGNVPAVMTSDVLNATTSGVSGTASGITSLANVVV